MNIKIKLMRYKSWIITLIIALTALLIITQKLQNNQIELTQPNASQTLTRKFSTVGQTFVASEAGLQGIALKGHAATRCEDKASPCPSIILHLRASPTATTDLRQATASLAYLTANEWLRFSFEPLPASRLTTYYFFIEPPATTGTLYYGPAESYLDGAMVLNGQPQEGQLTFYTVYNRFEMARELWQNFIIYLPANLMAFSTFFLAGWVLLILSQAQQTLIIYWVEGFIVAIGLGLSWYPLLLLWTDTLGLHLGQSYIWLTLIVSLAILIKYYWTEKPTLATLHTWLNSPERWSDLALLIVITIAALGRVLMVRNLEMPLWDDSVHHTVMVQRILETGGLFQSWQPYTPYETLSFHFGFHVNMAVLAWATGVSAPQAVIWGGQWMNLLAALSLYPLAYRWQGRWAGVLAVFIASLFTEFPLYYVNWGRYAQLMGQVLLPLACWWTLALVTQKKLAWQKQLLLGLGGALLIFGAMMSYYRMAFHYIAFLVAVGLVYLPHFKKFDYWRNWLPVILTLLLTLIFASSWFIHLGTRQNAVDPTPSAIQPTQAIQAILFWQQIQNYQINALMTYLSVFLVGTLLVIWAGRKVAIPLVWLWLLLILPFLKLLPLPGVAIIQEFTLQISIYMLQAIIWGLAGGWLIEKTIANHKLGLIGLVIAISLAALVKLPDLPQIVDREFDLSTRPDLQAATWIKQNLPSQALFLINGLVYQGKSALATDAGSWLPILTQRQVTIPPQYALLEERSSSPDYTPAVNRLTKTLVEHGPNTPLDKTALCQFPQPITHVYIGQKRGLVTKAIPNPPTTAMLSPEMLLQDSAFKLIYQQDRVLIFEFNRAICHDKTP